MFDTFLSEALQHPGTQLAVNFIISIAVIALFRVIGSRILAKYRLRALPLVNGIGVFESDKRSNENFMFNAQSLLDDGYAKVSYSSLSRCQS